MRQYFLLVLLGIVSVAAPTMAGTDTLVVRVTNILRQAGIIDVTVYRNDSTFLSDKSWAANKDVRLDTTFTKGICDITVVLPHDEYALVVFQDINLNGKLDVNFIGYPNEPFAFSRHFHPRFRAPKFCEISFQCKHPRDTLVVPLMN